MTGYTGVVRTAASTGSTTTDLTISAFGTPVGAVLAVDIATADASETAEASLSIGFWASSGTVRALGYNSEDNKTTRTDTYTIRTKDHALVVIDNAGAIVRTATISTITNGIRITWKNSAGTNTAPPANWKVQARLFGGTDAACEVVDVAGPSAAGAANTVISSLSFAPEGIYFLGAGTFSVSPTSVAGAGVSFGFSGKTGAITNACGTWFDQDNTTTITCNSIARNDACLVNPNSTADPYAITAYSSNGFTLHNVNQNTTGPASVALAFTLGTQVGVRCGILDTPTSTGNATSTAPGFRPQGMDFALALVGTTNTEETDDDASAIGIGMADSSASSCLSTRSDDGIALGTTDSGSTADSKPVRVLDGSGAAALVGAWNAWTDAGITINWTTVMASARRLPFIAIQVQPQTLTPSAAAVTTAIADATRALILTPNAAAVTLDEPSATRQLILTPSAAAVTLAEPDATRQLLLTPNALAATLAIPDATRALLLAPDPAAVTLALPDIVRKLLLAPDPLAASLALPDATRALLLAADPLGVLLAIPDLGATITLSPDPLELELELPDPALALELLLAPDPLAATLALPAATRALLLAPDPLAASLALADLTRALLLTPDPLEAALAAPSSTRALLIDPDALAVLFDVPALVGPLNLTPSPLAVTLTPPAAARQLILAPDPTAISLEEPAAARALVLAPDPAAVTLALPATTRELILTPSPLAVALAEPPAQTEGLPLQIEALGIALELPAVTVLGIDILLSPDPLELELALPDTAGGQAKLGGLRLRSRVALELELASRTATTTTTSSRVASALELRSRLLP